MHLVGFTIETRQCEPSNTSMCCGWEGTSQSQPDNLLLSLNFELQQGTPIHHSQAAQPRLSSSTLYSEAPYFSLTALHLYICSYSFWTSALLKPANSLPLQWVTTSPTADTKPTDFNPGPTALYISCFRGSNIMTHSPWSNTDLKYTSAFGKWKNTNQRVEHVMINSRIYFT